MSGHNAKEEHQIPLRASLRAIAMWHSNAWLAYGVLPVVSANIGFWLPMLVLEFHLQRTNFSNTIERKGGRKRAVLEGRERVPLSKQLRVAAFVLLGPTALINGVLSAYLIPWLVGPVNTVFPKVAELVFHLVLLELIGDFGLYAGHRVQHEVEFLWRNFHSFHHQIGTPSPASTIYIDTTDATLQAGLPVVLATAMVRPHPFTYNVYIGLRIAENVLNHSGLDDGVINVLTLKFLPGRAEIAHHDYHHQFSNYGRNSKNFGENFWLWDWAFGTLSKVATKRVA